MRNKITAIILVLMLVVSSSLVFAASTYWLDSHYWTTDQTTINLWGNYLDDCDEVEYWEGKVAIKQDYLDSVKSKLDSATRNLLQDVALSIGWGYMAYNNPAYMGNFLEQVASTADSFVARNQAVAAHTAAVADLDYYLDNFEDAVRNSKKSHKIVWDYDWKWGTIKYAP